MKPRDALACGGKVRVVFENNIHASDRPLAISNCARVAQVLNR